MKLYWRYKKHGKWTWRPAKLAGNINVPEIIVIPMEEE